MSATVEVPAAAREKTEKGAEAFVRFFFDQVNAGVDQRRIRASSRTYRDAGL